VVPLLELGEPAMRSISDDHGDRPAVVTLRRHSPCGGHSVSLGSLAPGGNSLELATVGDAQRRLA
jgi:hypothetical protein